MTSDGHFFVDGKPYQLEHSPVRVSVLLDLVGSSASEAILVSEDGTEYADPGMLIEIVPGDRFLAKRLDQSQRPVDRPIRYTVNGEENATIENPLSLESILRNAGAGAAIDVSDLQSYYLENTADSRRYENLDDLVMLTDGDNFVAIHVGSTPVA